MIQRNKTLDWIQALRGIAALLVVLTHGRIAFLDTPQWMLADQLFFPGAMGVDLFFILSGFIIVFSTTKSDGSFAYSLNFAIKRFARIWPAYAVVSLILMLSTKEGFGYFQNSSNVSIFWKSLFFIQTDPALPLFFGLTLAVGWTLEFEIYFYFIFAISMLFGRLRWIALFAWILLTLVLLPWSHGSLSPAVRVTQPFSWSYMQLVANPIVWEFIAGVVIGKLYLAKSIRIKSKEILYMLMTMGISFPLWYAYTGVGDFHGPSKWGWPLALMVLIIAIASKTLEIQVPKILNWLGKISFSLYLTHTVVQNFLNRIMEILNLEKFAHSWGHLFLFTISSIVVASFAYHFLEKGLSEFVRDLLLRQAKNLERYLSAWKNRYLGKFHPTKIGSNES